ncbi:MULTISPECIES: ABC transporter substrate-binding protein [Thalassospira]|uniref:LacI family transcriptional regulator n=2 Tax=Thalassospira TaxID=168934 RepID=A0A367VX29_9PROT|nr:MULTISPECIES: ABC transporter substrate-binding protein [Thalassospira]MDG4717822.1 ABC transporter substrate-binding protein [Thalassospira sp. FZY0004]RCK30340.1 LacI family transcriptional regulator [Thalassospira profundimaris]
MRKIVSGILGLIASVALVTGAAAADKEIAVIVKTTNSNFWQNVNKGASSAAAKAEGYDITFQGPESDTAIAEQVNLVQNAINRKVAGIVLAPSDTEALVPVVKSANENGIPVVIIDSLLSKSAESYYQAFLATDNRKAGELVAQMMIDKVGKTGKVAVMSFVAGVGSEIGRVGGFIEYIKANSDIEIVGPFYSQSQMALALNQTTDVLSANGDLKGIYGASEPTAVGMARAILQSGKAGKLVAIGFDGNKDLQDFIRDGTLDAIAVQSSFQMGQLGVNAVIDVAEGKTVEKFINTGLVMVTKENIDSAEAQNVLY